eukprot:2780844-Pyramimonas_sp.AAC.1
MARGDAARGASAGRANGKRKTRGGGGVLRWGDAEAQKAQAAAAALRAAEGSGAGGEEGAPG